jgi:hypothetical protein
LNYTHTGIDLFSRVISARNIEELHPLQTINQDKISRNRISTGHMRERQTELILGKLFQEYKLPGYFVSI